MDRPKRGLCKSNVSEKLRGCNLADPDLIERRKLELKRNMFECKGRTFLVWKQAQWGKVACSFADSKNIEAGI